MSTYTAYVEIVKDGKTTKFVVDDSYSFRNNPRACALYMNVDEVIKLVNKAGSFYGGDGWISYRTDGFYALAEEPYIINEDMEKKVISKTERYNPTEVYINYDTETFKCDGSEEVTFNQLRYDTISDTFYS